MLSYQTLRNSSPTKSPITVSLSNIIHGTYHSTYLHLPSPKLQGSGLFTFGQSGQVGMSGDWERKQVERSTFWEPGELLSLGRDLMEGYYSSVGQCACADILNLKYKAAHAEYQ